MEQPREERSLSVTEDPITDESSLLVDFLSQRDVPCPLCGYNLRGLNSMKCPECGRQLRLSVGLAEPFLRGWVMLATGVFASAGVGVFLLVLFSRRGWPHGQDGLFEVSAVYYMISPVFAWPTIAARKQFLRLNKSWQYGWAVVALALFVVSLVMLVRNA